MHPRPLIVCGPSGSGKSTLIKMLFQEFPHILGYSISHTTRKPRPGEENGVHYYFTDCETMRDDICAGKFLESAEYSGNLYGTSIAAIEAVRKQGKVCVLDIDLQGYKQIRASHFKPWSVFINPPSFQDLEKRLRSRQTETEESLQARLQVAIEEIKYGTHPGNFDFIIVNDRLERAYKELRNILVNKIMKTDI